MMETLEITRGAGPFVALVDAVERGAPIPTTANSVRYPLSFVEDASVYFGVPTVRIRSILGLPAVAGPAAASSGNYLNAEASACLWWMADVASMAREFFPSEQVGAEWMGTPRLWYSGKAPIDFLSTEVGASYMRSVISGLMYGGVA